MTRAYLGLGSNLGDRLENLRRAVELLGQRGVPIVRSSRVYETEPVGGPPQPEYLNAVVEAEAGGTAWDLLASCREVEQAMGRERAERWGPRVIDVDVLTFGDEVVEEPGLEIPHPRMHERAFVLVPLLELDPDPPLPGGRRAATLRVDALGVRLHAPPLVG
ncbi:MAG: 2-amino-4-hydroxy-6-hydroxymethyldihydropteridine diphosphokinase [Actinomycetota bacterium]